MKAITKIVKQQGNSGGVYVPNSWIGGRVKIELVEEPTDPKNDIVAAIDTKHVMGVILYGSYTRDEMESASDIDVIVVTDSDSTVRIPLDLKKKYDIHVMTIDQLKKAVANDPILYKALKDDGEAVLNSALLDELWKMDPPRGKIRSRLDLIESSLRITQEVQRLEGDLLELVYSLVMRLKEALILECLVDGKKYSTRILKRELLRCGISEHGYANLMAAYRAQRSGKPVAEKVSDLILAKLITLLEAKVEHVRKTAHKKGN